MQRTTIPWCLLPFSVGSWLLWSCSCVQGRSNVTAGELCPGHSACIVVDLLYKHGTEKEQYVELQVLCVAQLQSYKTLSAMAQASLLKQPPTGLSKGFHP